VSNVSNRLKKLEGEEPERCNDCLPWGDAIRIAHCHEDGPTSEPTGPPECCETCGYEPVLIIVHSTHEAAKM
jgi:hypothetical protein